MNIVIQQGSQGNFFPFIYLLFFGWVVFPPLSDMEQFWVTDTHLGGPRKGCSHTRQQWDEGLSQGPRGRHWAAPGDPGAQGSWRCCLLGSSGVKFSSACPGGGLACAPPVRLSLSSVAGGRGCQGMLAQVVYVSL